MFIVCWSPKGVSGTSVVASALQERVAAVAAVSAAGGHRVPRLGQGVLEPVRDPVALPPQSAYPT